MTKKKQSKGDELLLEYRRNFKRFANDCITIRDHNTASLVPLKFNNGQKILHAVAEKQKKERGYVRILLIKCRRFGGSTYIEGRCYWRTALQFNRNTFIVGHENDSTATLFRMAQLMQERNPIAPSTKASNAQELRFDNASGTGLKSEYRLACARNLDAGRSQGIHYLHGSEEAFWPDAHTLLNSLMQCVPPPPAETEVFRESTANGFGNAFQEDIFATYAEGRYPYYSASLRDFVEGAADIDFNFAYHNPKSDWVVVFIPWFVHEKYTRKFDDTRIREEFAEKIEQRVFDDELLEWVDSEPKKLQEKYGVSLEQLWWREYAIENYCRGNEDTFRQEYPAEIEEAFLSTGQNVYSKQLCDQIEENCAKPVLIGEPVDRAGKTVIRPNKHGHFSVWEKPESDESYFITVDPGGGIKPSHEKNNKEPDPTCIDVYNHRTGVQVAQWHGHMDYGLIANVVALIGRWYGYPTACVELQNHGYTVVKDLRELRYPLYEYKPEEPGWLTTKKSKPLMVDDLGEMARNGDINIRSSETVSEMRTFVEENGKYNASLGCHDDRVICAAMGTQMLKALPKKFRKRRGDREFIGFTNIVDRHKKQEQEYQEYYVS